MTVNRAGSRRRSGVVDSRGARHAAQTQARRAVASVARAAAVAPAASSGADGYAAFVGQLQRARVPVLAAWQEQTASTLEHSAAAHEHASHAAALGLADTATTADIWAAELQQCQQAEPRLSPQVYQHSLEQGALAQTLTPTQRPLCGLTRLLDAKFSLTPKVVEALVALAEHETSPRALADAINHGPTSGPVDGDAKLQKVNRSPQTLTELTASLVRWLALGDGSSVQLNMSVALEQQLRRALEQLGVAPAVAPGGGGAFAASIGAVAGCPRVTFVEPQRMPKAVAEAFGEQVHIAEPGGATHLAADAGDAGVAPRTNYSAEYGSNDLTFHGASEVIVNGAPHALHPARPGRLILSTPAHDDPTLERFSSAELTALGREHDVFFFAGPHYWTTKPPAQRQRVAARFVEQLRELKEANPSITHHWQYVMPKDPPGELDVLRAFEGELDSMSLNADELGPLLHQLARAGLIEATPLADADPQHVGSLLQMARLLKEGLQLKQVHLHAFAGDLLVEDPPKDPERKVQSLYRARQMASIKAANLSGAIVHPDEHWSIAPGMMPQGAVGLYQFADALDELLGLRDGAIDQVLRNKFYVDRRSDTFYAFVPSRGLHDFRGGTVSVGDTIDFTKLIFSGEGS